MSLILRYALSGLLLIVFGGGNYDRYGNWFDKYVCRFLFYLGFILILTGLWVG